MKVFIWIILGAIGTGFIIYGKRQQNYIFFLSGALLYIIPYFFKSIISLILTSVLIIAFPFFWD